MGKEFKRLKRYHGAWMAFRCVAVGLSVTLLLAGLILLATKLHVLEGTVIYYLFSAVVGIGLGVLYWLLQSKSDLRLAETIDAEHQLRERVQTMVEYWDGESAMLQVQREDTEKRLQSVRAFGHRKLTLAGHFLLIVVAFAVFAVGFMMPVQAVVEPTQPTEPPYEVTEWQKSAVAELVKHVQKSDMIQSVKDPTVAQLQDLLVALDTQMTVSALKARVSAVMEKVYALTDEANANDDIYDCIHQYTEHTQAGLLAYALCALENVERDGQIEMLRAAMEKEEGLATAGALAEGLELALGNAQHRQDDPLYMAVAELAQQLHAVAAAVEAADTANAKMLLGSAFGQLKVSTNAALEQQELTKAECVYVVDTLCTIFGITGADRPGDPDGEMLLQRDEENYVPSQGGYGTGDLQVAGDDEIYDYRQHTYTAYGELLKEYYYKQALQHMDTMDEEVRQIVEKYFNELYTGEEEN